jgi:hypothetical protein
MAGVRGVKKRSTNALLGVGRPAQLTVVSSTSSEGTTGLKISELIANNPATALTDTDGFEITQDGESRGATAEQLRAFVNNNAGFILAEDYGTERNEITFNLAAADALARGLNVYVGPGTWTSTPDGRFINPGVEVAGAGPTLTHFVKTGQNACFTAAGTGVVRSGPSAGTRTTNLAADVALNAMSIALLAGQVAAKGFVVGQTCVLVSDDLLSPLAAGQSCAEFINIQNIVGDVIWLWSPTKNAYTTALHAELLPVGLLEGVAFRDLSIQMDVTATVNSSDSFQEMAAIDMRWCNAAVVENVYIHDGLWAGVFLAGCLSAKVTDCRIDDLGSTTAGTSDPTSVVGYDGFGYAVREDALNEALIVSGLVAHRCRSGYMAGAGYDSVANFGSQYGSTIADSVHYDAKGAGWNTHWQTYGITFNNVGAIGSWGNGFTLYSRSAKLVGCYARHCMGNAVSIRGSNNAAEGLLGDQCEVADFTAEQTNTGWYLSAASAEFTGSISGTALTVSGVSGTIATGHLVIGTGVAIGTLITAGAGTSWTVGISQTVPSGTMMSGVGTDAREEGAVIDRGYDTKVSGLNVTRSGGPALQIGGPTSLIAKRGVYRNLNAWDVCQSATTSKYVVNVSGVQPASNIDIDGVTSHCSDGKVEHVVYRSFFVNGGVNNAVLNLKGVNGYGHTGAIINSIADDASSTSMGDAGITVMPDNVGPRYCSRPGLQLYEDFLGVALSVYWAGVVGSDPQCVGPTIVAPSNKNGGRCRLTAGDTGAQTMATDGVCLVSALNWRAQYGGLSAEFKLLVGSNADLQLFAGFTDTVALEMPFAVSGGGAITSVATDAVGFLYDTNFTVDVWRTVGVANNVNASGSALARGATTLGWQRLRVDVSSTGVATFWFNGTLVATLAGALAPTIPLTPCVAILSRTTAVKTVDIDSIYVEQNGTTTNA